MPHPQGAHAANLPISRGAMQSTPTVAYLVVILHRSEKTALHVAILSAGWTMNL